MEKSLQLLWVKNIEGFEPNDNIHQQIADLVADSQEEIDLELEQGGCIAMFGEIDEWFLKLEITKEKPYRVLISHFDQDEWLDEINKSKKEEKNDNPFNVIKLIITDVLGVEPMEVTRDANLVNDLGADSLDKVDIVMQVENNLDIRIEEEFEYSTVQDLINRVSNGL